MRRNKENLFCLTVFSLLFFANLCYCQEIRPLEEISANDRILILAPHPDDEAIGTGGIIQRALKAGAKVKVVCFTNGDNNELAFIVYEKRLTFRKGEFLHMGEVRRIETIAAMTSLGLSEKDIIFLGYPDFGTMEILTKYWQTPKPFKTLFTRVSKVPYQECLSPGAPFVGESILKDLKIVISGFKPTKIFVSHPVDTNRDHRSLYLFLQVALWDLEKQISQPEVFPCLIHLSGWPRPRGLHSDLRLDPPDKLKDAEISWQRIELNDEEINAKNQAITFYKSQIEYDPPYLFSFVRKNELFGEYPIIKVQPQANENTHQQTGQSANKNEATEEEAKVERVAYAQKDKDLVVRLTLRRKIDKNFGVSIFLLGYSKTKNFAAMPKIRLGIGIAGLRINEKKQPLFVKNAQLRYEGKTLVIKVPLSLLGNPDYILSSARTNIKDLPYDDTAWRIIDLN